MPGPDPAPLTATLTALASALEDLHVDWYLLGALAAQVHGVVRSTGDVDVTVKLGSTSTDRLVARLRDAGFEPIFDDHEFIEASRVIPVRHAGSGVVVDIALAGPGLEDRFLDRTSKTCVAGVEIPVASAEDLLLMKMLAAREKDLADCRAILRASGTSIDKEYIEAALCELEEALSQSDLVPLWQRLLMESGQQS